MLVKMFSIKSRPAMKLALVLTTLGAVLLFVSAIPEDGMNIESTDTDEPTDSEVHDLANRVARDVEHLAAPKRFRRTIDMSTPLYLPRKIPYVYSDSYSNPYYQTVFSRAASMISSRVCVDFVDETDGFDSSDPNFFRNLGYGTETYLSVVNGSGCSNGNSGGPLPDGGPIRILPCTGTDISMHEMAHALGARHVQMALNSHSYINVHSDNINPVKLFNFIVGTTLRPDKVYDKASNLHYSNYAFTANNLKTISCVRDDICEPDEDSTDDMMIRELNDLYKCVDIFCADVTTDCSPGFLTYKDKKCQCVCPTEYTKSSNCKHLVNGADTSLSWTTPASVFAGGVDNSCPDGFTSSGWLSIPPKSKHKQYVTPVAMPLDGQNINIPICSRTEGDTKNWMSFPMGGAFCFIAPKGISACGTPFNDFFVNMQAASDISYNGSIGDVTVNGSNMTMRLCCRKDDSADTPLELPNSKPFRMINIYGCARIRGMREYATRLDISTISQSFSGGPAKALVYSLTNVLILNMCYYMPPVYGCSVNTVLNFTNRAVTIVTPGFPTARTPNMRCFYTFQVPDNVQLRLTFNSYNLSFNDKFLVKRYSMWNAPYRIDNYNYPSQMISESNYLGLEFWAGYESVLNPGANFTVDAIFDMESCYNDDENGTFYLGDTSITEYSEPCLYWKDTVNCADSPYNTEDVALQYLTGNKCRNPGGKFLQPWCFVYMNGTNCDKRYCDVCNNYAVVDKLNSSTCSKSISDDPTACASSPQRFSCAKTCNLPRASTGVTVCKPGWHPYKDRCVYLSAGTASHDAAKAACSNLASGATLYQVRDLDDQNYLQLIKTSQPGSFLWINGKLDTNVGKWYYEDTNILLSYTNWTANAVLNNQYYPCVAVYLPTASAPTSGGWRTFNCMTTAVYYVCQTVRTATCGRPSLPPDAVASSNVKSFYRVGERVYIGCKYDPVYFRDQRSIMCTKNGWTTFPSVCTECPNSWTPYQNLCLYMSPDLYSRADAEYNCRSVGRNGTLVQITDAAKHAAVKDLRVANGINENYHSWVSGSVCNVSGPICYTDTSTVMTYGSLTGSTSRNCVYLYRTSSSSGRGGILDTTSCSDSSNTFTLACQMDKLSVPTALDGQATCQDILSEFPNFCQDPQATSYCAKSCGQNSGTTKCATPSSSTYTRTSPNATVSPGGVMTFACQPGYFLVSGNTSRACGISGNLLGVEPVCSATPSALTLNYFLLTKMRDVLPAKQAFILDQDNYRIPITGKITAWFTYCVNSGTIYFLVYRKNGSSYNLVGSNQFECQPNSIFRYTVPTASQITVLKDDMIGAFSPAAATLSITDCTGAINMLMTIPSPTADSITSLQTITSPTMKCVIPALTCTVAS